MSKSVRLIQKRRDDRQEEEDGDDQQRRRDKPPRGAIDSQCRPPRASIQRRFSRMSFGARIELLRRLIDRDLDRPPRAPARAASRWRCAPIRPPWAQASRARAGRGTRGRRRRRRGGSSRHGVAARRQIAGKLVESALYVGPRKIFDKLPRRGLGRRGAEQHQARAAGDRCARTSRPGQAAPSSSRPARSPAGAA